MGSISFRLVRGVEPICVGFRNSLDEKQALFASPDQSHDSAFSDFVEAPGGTPIKSFWMKNVDPSYIFEVPIAKPF
jgi:hypothetical protein